MSCEEYNHVYIGYAERIFLLLEPSAWKISPLNGQNILS